MFAADVLMNGDLCVNFPSLLRELRRANPNASTGDLLIKVFEAGFKLGYQLEIEVPKLVIDCTG